MSKRLQVVMDDAELREIKRVAKQNRMTVAEWVRRTLREARRVEPSVSIDKKLQVVREAARHRYPVGGVTEMLEEIERGYLQGSP